MTAEVKATFSVASNSLIERGSRLIADSVASGVTSIRAHVEVDAIVGSTCLEAAIALRKRWESVCDIHIASEDECAF